MGLRFASVDVALDQTIGTVSPRLFGSACWYADGHIWVGEDSPIPNTRGFRNDVVAALTKLSPQALSFSLPMLYRWQDGIGPQAKRPSRFWGLARSPLENYDSVELSNAWGTHEFLDLCELVGAEPVIQADEDDPMESRNWVEYCVYDGDTRWTRLRKANGRAEPWPVRIWHLYAWRDHDPDVYAKNYRVWANYTRLLCPEIELVVAGNHLRDWDPFVFDALQRVPNPSIGGLSLVDHVAYIFYFANRTPDVAFSDGVYYRSLQNAGGLGHHFRKLEESFRRYDQQRSAYGSRTGWMEGTRYGTRGEPMKLAVFEWGTAFRFERQTLRDAIVAAGVLDSYIQWIPFVSMAFLTHTTGPGMSLIMTQDEQMWVTPVYHVVDMYSPFKGKQAVQVEVAADDILPEARAREEEFFGGASIAELSSLPMLTSSAARSSSGEEVIVSATNRHLEDEVRVEINLKNSARFSSGEVKVLSSPNVRDHNSSERPELISPISSNVAVMYNKLTYTLPPHSVGVFQIRL